MKNLVFGSHVAMMAAALFFSECKKEEEDKIISPDYTGIPTTNAVVYDGMTYGFDEASLIYYGSGAATGYFVHNFDIVLDGASAALMFETLHQSSKFTFGQYTCSDTMDAGTFFGSYISEDTPGGLDITGGHIEVSTSGDDYRLKASCVTSEGKTLKAYFIGQVTYYDRSE